MYDVYKGTRYIHVHSRASSTLYEYISIVELLVHRYDVHRLALELVYTVALELLLCTYVHRSCMYDVHCTSTYTHRTMYIPVCVQVVALAPSSSSTQ